MVQYGFNKKHKTTYSSQFLAIVRLWPFWDGKFTWPLQGLLVTSNPGIQRSRIESPGWQFLLPQKRSKKLSNLRTNPRHPVIVPAVFTVFCFFFLKKNGGQQKKHRLSLSVTWMSRAPFDKPTENNTGGAKPPRNHSQTTEAAGQYHLFWDQWLTWKAWNLGGWRFCRTNSHRNGSIWGITYIYRSHE